MVVGILAGSLQHPEEAVDIHPEAAGILPAGSLPVEGSQLAGSQAEGVALTS